MLYHANGKITFNEKKVVEGFDLEDIRYKHFKSIKKNKNDKLFKQYYVNPNKKREKEQKKESKESLNNIFSKNNKIGIGNKNPIGTLSLGDSSKESDGNLVIAKKKGIKHRHFKTGFDDQFWYNVGDYGTKNRASTWKKPFRIKYNAPNDSLTISNRGLVGMGTSNPYAKLTVDSYTDSQIQRLRNKKGYYDVDIADAKTNDSEGQKTVQFSTDTDKYEYDKPISIDKVLLESRKKDGQVGIDFNPNKGNKKLAAVQVTSSYNKTGNSEGAYLYLGRKDNKTGKDLKHVSYDVQGNIGIGVTNPQAKLHIETNTNNSRDNGVRFKSGGPHISHSAWGPSNDWYIRSGHKNGKVVIQDHGGRVETNNITFKNNGVNWSHRKGGDAAIVNSNNYNTLMIVGRGDGKRRIGMWDNVTVNGNLGVKDNLNVNKNLSIEGETCFNGVCIKGQDLVNLKNSVKDLGNGLNQNRNSIDQNRNTLSQVANFSFKLATGSNKPSNEKMLSDNQWGDIRTHMCPAGTYMCGIKIRHEPQLSKDKDDTGVNGLGVYCCPFYK